MNESGGSSGCQPRRYNISVQMETKSQMLQRKAICIDLFVPFLRTTTCCKMESYSQSESTSTPSRHPASLFNPLLFHTRVQRE